MYYLTDLQCGSPAHYNHGLSDVYCLGTPQVWCLSYVLWCLEVNDIYWPKVSRPILKVGLIFKRLLSVPTHLNSTNIAIRQPGSTLHSDCTCLHTTWRRKARCKWLTCSTVNLWKEWTLGNMDSLITRNYENLHSSSVLKSNFIISFDSEITMKYIYKNVTRAEVMKATS